MSAQDPENDYDSALSSWFSRPNPAPEDDDLLGPKKLAVAPEILARVREWTRERFKLSGEDAILVSEIACKLPGCPPLETAIAFWSGGQRHHFKLFKRVVEVKFDDLPYPWMKDDLIVPEGFECECC
jgi:nitrate reductase delta subunit